MYVLPLGFALVWYLLGWSMSDGALVGFGAWLGCFALWFLGTHVLAPLARPLRALDIGNPERDHEDIGEQPEPEQAKGPASPK